MLKKISIVCTLLCSLQASAAKEHQLDVILDWVVNPNHGPIIVAKQKGYFKDEHLNVQLHEPTDPSMPAKLVAAKKYDLAVTYQEDFTYDLAKNLPLMKVSTLISSPLNCIMVLKKSGITKLSQLDGKKLGYSIPSSKEALHVMVGYGLEKKPKVDMVHVGWNISQSLLSGRVDAVSGGYRNFEKYQLNAHGEEVVMFFPEDYGVPVHDELILVSHQNAKKTEAFRGFNRALERATQYISNHPDLAWQDFIAYNPKNLDNPLNKKAWMATLIRYDHRPGAVDASRYLTYANYMHQHHIIQKIPDFSKALFR
jgi:putative hydroxymethylpyrimidine transport system substrate-binding protein